MERARITALRALDEAIELTRFESLRALVRCTLPGLALTWLVLLAYYCERVEGITGLRPLFALALVATWCVRGVVLGRFARRHAERALFALEQTLAPQGPRTLLGMAALLGIELWLWLWLLVLAVRSEPWLTLVVLPMLAVRGAWMPSWLAVAATQPDSGMLRAAGQSWSAAKQLRTVGMACELFLLLAAAALFFNLGALLAALLSVSQELLGLELSFVRAFISPRNHFMMLALAGLSLSALEPVRASLAAVLYVDARSQDEAATLRVLLKRCIDGQPANVLLALLLTVSAASYAHAQEPTSETQTVCPPAGEPDCDDACTQARARDDALLVDLVQLLGRDEFQEFSGHSYAFEETFQDTLDRWVRALLEWLLKAPTERDYEPGTKLQITSTRGLLIGAAVAVAAALLLYVVRALWKRQHARTRQTPSEAAPQAPNTLREQLDAALALAARDPRGALRMLYLISLHTLAQRGLLRLHSDATNGQYARALATSSAHQPFSQLTDSFERAQYGALPPNQDELVTALHLTQTLSDVEETR